MACGLAGVSFVSIGAAPALRAIGLPTGGGSVKLYVKAEGGLLHLRKSVRGPRAVIRPVPLRQDFRIPLLRTWLELEKADDIGALTVVQGVRRSHV